MRQAIVHFFHGTDFVAENFRADLNFDVDLVQSALASEHDPVMRQRTLDGQQRRLDLRGENIDAADDEHVVAASADALNAPNRASA